MSAPRLPIETPADPETVKDLCAAMALVGYHVPFEVAASWGRQQRIEALEWVGSALEWANRRAPGARPAPPDHVKECAL